MNYVISMTLNFFIKKLDTWYMFMLDTWTHVDTYMNNNL